ncbi:MAG: carboxypeptidase-like regulatory domain-containing protein [Tannerellaceae bacterium]|nr:carboxypeptidase-like regulatory domain-containing protein [Tannerellaceae bacterium]
MKTIRIISRLLAGIIALSLYPSGILYAQQVIAGEVVDAGTREPVSYATIQLLHGESGKPVTYTLTGPEGEFSLQPGNYTDSLVVQVALLGYEKTQVRAVPGQVLRIEMETRYFDLKEVEIRPGRVWGRGDTINYRVDGFLSAQDHSIKDVISKMPGVDINEAGRITYNGKAISNFYVEGLDLMGGRYRQMTDNLRAESVETVQVLENHQPIRILTNKINTEDIALNLKLKPEFRGRWMFTLKGGAGLSPFMWETDDNAIQIARGSQSTYIYKSNNTGYDAAIEQDILQTHPSNHAIHNLYPLIPQPSPVASGLKENRWLFNNVHTFSANRLYRIKEETRLRVNANYMRDIREQEREEETHYYATADTFSVYEKQTLHQRRDKAELGLNLENNTPDRYLVNRFDLSGSRNRSRSSIYNTIPVNQQIKSRELQVGNNFHSIHPGGNYNIEYRSQIHYLHLPSSFRTEEENQTIHLNSFYTNNSVSFIRKQHTCSRQYTAGVMGEVNGLKNGYGFYATPQHQLNKGKLLITARMPVEWRSYKEGGLSRFFLNPSFSIRYKYNYRWQFQLYGDYNETYGDITHFYNHPYYTDYRHIRFYEAGIPVDRRQLYSFRIEYKNTIKELFFTLNPVYTRTAHNQIREQYIEHDILWTVYRKKNNSSETYSLNATLSKGFYDWRLTTSLGFQSGRSKGVGIMEGEYLAYTHDYMRIEPKINWAPAKAWDIQYAGTGTQVRSGVGTSSLDPLWNIVQRVTVSYELFPVTLLLSGDHYYNQLTKG